MTVSLVPVRTPEVQRNFQEIERELNSTTSSLVTLNGVQTLTNKNLTSGTNTFPTFNQNTTGSAAKWTTARNLAGNSVDGSANVAFSNKFIVQGTTDTGLSGAQFLGALGTGILKNTTTTGVLSIATGADLPSMTATVGGAVPTPPNNTTTFLRGDGTFAVPAGSGDVTGPAASVDSEVALFSLTTGKVIKRASVTGIAKLTSGVLSAVTAPSGAIVGDTDTQTLSGKTISGSSNTLSNIANASLTNSSVTIGSTAVSLGGTAATLAGLTLTTPTIGSFTNATHSHLNAAGGGTITTPAVVNSYMFRVYRSSAQNTGNGAFAKIQYNSEDFDVGNNFDSSTNFLFTAPVAGKYQFNARFSTSVTNSTGIIALFKNGTTEVSRGSDIRNTTGVLGLVVSDVLSLAANDTVEVRAFGTTAIAMETGTEKNYFSGFFISS